MTSPVLTVETEAPLDDAAAAMLDQGIKSVVAVDEDCRPEGILTSTDFVQLAADRAAAGETTVGDYMTQDIVTATSGEPVPEVAERMLDEAINHLPVVDPDGQVTGILTTTDLAAYVSEFDAQEAATQLP